MLQAKFFRTVRINKQEEQYSNKNEQYNKLFQNCIITPFENAQRWMGQNTFQILLLNVDNMIGEQQETRMKMPNMCPFEKKEKEVF